LGSLFGGAATTGKPLLVLFHEGQDLASLLFGQDIEVSESLD
jgi:hypothetical protein